MKSIICKDQYERNLIPIIHGFSPYVIVIALVAVIIYKVTMLASSGSLAIFISPEVLADIFFYTVIFWAAFYLLKKSWLGNTLMKAYGNPDTDDDRYFLPAVRGTSIINSKTGMIAIDDQDIYFTPNRLSPEKDKMRISKADVRFEVEEHKSNFMIRAFWG